MAIADNDPFAQFKAAQREGWALFVPLEAFTTPAAARLVDFARAIGGRPYRECTFFGSLG